PVTQVVASARPLDLDDIRAEIGKEERQHVARNQARHVDDLDIFEGPILTRIKSFHLYCSGYPHPGGAGDTWETPHAPQLRRMDLVEAHAGGMLHTSVDLCA